MSFLFNEFFGGMPGGHHFHGHGQGNDSDDEPVDTEGFYKTLGIEKDATPEQIKKAYRKKAKTLHPDRHPDEREKYQSLFQDVQRAHEVLKDPQKRALYDKYGEKGVKRGPSASRSGSSLFEQMFSGHSGARSDNGHKKSPQIKTALDVTLTDIYCGSSKKVKIHRRVATNDSAICPRCKGQGQITQTQRMGPMVLQQRRECPHCGGIGYKLERQEHEIEVHIPVGGKHGENITISGEGNMYPDMAPGDVIIQLRQQKHKLFERKGADLGMNYTLSLRQALCGFKIKIPHVSGKNLIITPSEPNEIVQPGSLKVVHTLGLPQRYSPHVKGHLYIVCEVQMPKPNALSINTIKQFAKILPDTCVQQEYEKDNQNDNDNDNVDDEQKDQVPPPKQQQSKKSQHSKSNHYSNNNRNRSKKRQSKNNKKKKGKKKHKKGGLFDGLHGQFNAKDNNNKENTHNTVDKMDEDEDDEEMIEEVECHTCDGNPKATPASASNYYHGDEDQDDGVECRQM